jgi:hypothetical protein
MATVLHIRLHSHRKLDQNRFSRHDRGEPNDRTMKLGLLKVKTHANIIQMLIRVNTPLPDQASLTVSLVALGAPVGDVPRQVLANT